MAKTFNLNFSFTRPDEGNANVYHVGSCVEAETLAEAETKLRARNEHLTILSVTLFAVVDEDGNVITPSITKNEAAVLDHIARNSYSPVNYGKPVIFEEDCGAVWSHSILDSGSQEEVKPRSLPGIVASLQKKGLVVCTDSGTPDAAVGMTFLGFKAWEKTDAAKRD